MRSEHENLSYPYRADSYPRKGVLLLQFLASPFSRRLVQTLRMRGCDVHKINFCLGDKLFGVKGQTDYRGTLDEWPEFLLEYIGQHRVSNILLFGDCRPYHNAAVTLAASRGVSCHVFEEGYLRPDWVTFEEFGVNGFSRFPSQQHEVTHLASIHGKAAEPIVVGGGHTRRIVYEITSHLLTYFGAAYFPHYKRHRINHPSTEAAAWLRHAVLRPLKKHRAARAMDALMKQSDPYFLFPLQLSNDYQLRVHSPFKVIDDAISTVMASFAHSAPDKLRLAVKTHPIDPNSHRQRNLIKRLANENGIGSRVDFLDGGHLPTLIDAACGVVTINSTAGLQALWHGRPVKVLGDAIYNLQGITDQKSLDEFWNSPEQPVEQIFSDFRDALIGETQINGNFYTLKGIEIAVDTVVERILYRKPATKATAEKIADENWQVRLTGT